jgi:hypothetical protein
MRQQTSSGQRASGGGSHSHMEERHGGVRAKPAAGSGPFGRERAGKEAVADPCAMGVFTMVCVMTVLVLYAVPFESFIFFC